MSPGLWYWHDLPHPCPSEVSRISDPRIWQLLQYCLAYCCSALQLHLDLIYCCSVYILLHCVTYCCSVLHLPLDPTVLPFRTTDSRAPTLSDCCWVWQGVAGCCRVLQLYCIPQTAEHTHIRLLQRVVVCCNVLQGVAVCCSVLQCVAVVLYTPDSWAPALSDCCSVLQCVAAWCSVMQCVAACCSVLQKYCVPQTAKRPHVRLVVVGFVLAEFWRHVVWCSYHLLQCVAVL